MEVGDIKSGDTSTADNLNVIYSNVEIIRVETEPETGLLSIMSAYADSYEQRIVYENVLYSQIDQSAVGKRIAIVSELTPGDLRNVNRQALASRLIKECDLSNTDALDEMAKRGYRFFTHYIVNEDELIIIAKKLAVNND